MRVQSREGNGNCNYQSFAASFHICDDESSKSVLYVETAAHIVTGKVLPSLPINRRELSHGGMLSRGDSACVYSRGMALYSTNLIGMDDHVQAPLLNIGRVMNDGMQIETTLEV